MHPNLVEVLEEGRRLGFLGPGPVEDHVRHAEGFRAAARAHHGRVLDLGSGAGVPGLVLAGYWGEARVVLLDSNERRAAFLNKAVWQLGLRSRVTVLLARAEAAGRDPEHRGASDLVVARSFGAPAVVAECAAAFLEPGGRLIVSEPPSYDEERWPEAGLAQLGLRRDGLVVHPSGRFQVLVQEVTCPGRFPRRVGVPSKRPLFGARSVSREAERRQDPPAAL